ncbi:MAG: hypothetical protein D3924_08455 [Candidatus Electrothrix sp. AR4]|nr:hypothetical protein [Candidatus Electrothrix sp. AR4]
MKKSQSRIEMMMAFPATRPRKPYETSDPESEVITSLQNYQTRNAVGLITVEDYYQFSVKYEGFQVCCASSSLSTRKIRGRESLSWRPFVLGNIPEGVSLSIPIYYLTGKRAQDLLLTQQILS